ncbi:MAG TPA: squalene--hopene cyclase, partial [Streptosporangiaceae bacterium]|nr:squalene--hopene cyclase [Streptosporangiaceae bacterium]
MVADPAVLDLARDTLSRARNHALGLQSTQGWWQGELETNVTMDAEDLLLREFLGLHDDQTIAAAARWIRHQQRDDGTWANFYGGPGDLSTTVEAYVALRLAGDEPDAAHMSRARDWILAQGGVEATRVFTRMWLALSGRWSWDDLPVIPPELIYLPAWFPLNIYDWGCWARQTIVALAIVQSFRPSRPLPFTIDELKTGGPHGRGPRTPRFFDARPVPDARTSAADPWPHIFSALNKALHLYRPVKSVRRAALRRCAEWVIARQERDGCWGGIQPPWVYSLMALNLLGYDVEHPVMQRGLKGLDRFTITEEGPEGPVRRLEACQSPVWDTVLTMTALADAGLAADDPSLGRAARWVLSEEIQGPGDWQVRRPGTAPGGWAFEFDNDNYPDTDDTAEVVLALRRVRVPDEGAIQRGLEWLTGMQSKDGGWGAFDADNTRNLVNKLPFCDFGAVIDPPSADVTAHIVEAFAAEGLSRETTCRRGVTWLLRNQEPDGSWFGRWGANYL